MINRIFKALFSEVGRIFVSGFFFVSALILEQFEYSMITLALYVLSLLVSGGKVFFGAVRGILRADLLDERFLMTIAAIGAMIVGEYSEGCAVMLFFLIGETFEHHAVRKSRKSIRALMDICPDTACVVEDGEEISVDAEDVDVGSIIIIRPGERVPIDCEIISGSADVDTSSMTGEAFPVSKVCGDRLESGVVVLNGLLRCKTLLPSGDSAAARVLSLVETANERKSREESFITKFARFYTPFVVICALMLAIFLPLFSDMNASESIYRALIFLVISCPCALVISVPMSFFGGIGCAASRGILYKGGNIFSKLSKADTIAFDKTGTVTDGAFSVSYVKALGMSDKELLSIAASAEYTSNHPLAIALKSMTTEIIIPEFAKEIAGEGVIAKINGEEVCVGNCALMKRCGVDITKNESAYGVVFVSVSSSLVGIIGISDRIKSEALESIKELASLGVKHSIMLTGDRRENAIHTSEAVGINEAYFELSPEKKFEKLEKIISKSSGGVIYVGDGINDSPSLARADVGIAMGGMGQDAAIEASDIVIMSDNLKKIPEAIRISRKTLKIARENIIFALAIKGVTLLLGALGFANMWIAVFADVGVAVLAILNSMRALKPPKA